MPGVKGSSGRKRKPTLLKVVTGNPGHRKLPTSEPTPISDEPKPPAWLDEDARDKWREVLCWCHWITRADGDMLALYCAAWSRYLRAEKLAQAPIIKREDGRYYKNPAWGALNEAFQQLRSAGSELGLSPSARSGVESGKEKRDRIAEKYFA